MFLGLLKNNLGQEERIILEGSCTVGLHTYIFIREARFERISSYSYIYFLCLLPLLFQGCVSLVQ